MLALEKSSLLTTPGKKEDRKKEVTRLQNGVSFFPRYINVYLSMHRNRN